MLNPNSRIKIKSSLRNLCTFNAFISTIEPKNANESLHDAAWIIAMQEELHQFKRRNVWYLIPKLEDRTVIRTKWVFENKLDEQGTVTRNKLDS